MPPFEFAARQLRGGRTPGAPDMQDDWPRLRRQQGGNEEVARPLCGINRIARIAGLVQKSQIHWQNVSLSDGVRAGRDYRALTVGRKPWPASVSFS